MRSRARALGTERTRTPPSAATGWTPRNHVFQVASASWARNSSAQRCQMSSAVDAGLPAFSTEASTGVEKEDPEASRPRHRLLGLSGPWWPLGEVRPAEAVAAGQGRGT